MKLKDPPSLKTVPAMSVHSATGHDLCPVELTCCEITIGKSQFKHTFIVCKRLRKELINGLNMQQFHYLCCNQTDNKQIFLHQATKVVIGVIDVVTNITN